MTQNQLIELFESEHVKALIERAEEHGGQLEAPELEAFVLEHDIGEEDAELLQRELEAHNIEITQPDADEKEEASPRSGTRPAPSRAPRTASSSSSRTSVATSCSQRPKRSRSRSASSGVTRSPSA